MSNSSPPGQPPDSPPRVISPIAIPGLDSAPGGVGGQPTLEQLGRIHAATSARLQAAMDAPLPPSRGAARAPTAEDLAAVGGVAELGATQFEGAIESEHERPPPNIPGLNPAGYQAVIDHGDHVELLLKHGRRTVVTREQLAERARLEAEWATQNIRWEKELTAKYGSKKQSGWDVTPPTRGEIRQLLGRDRVHQCTTCKHAVQYVVSYASASGFSTNHVGRHFCSLIRDAEGGHLEFEDSPIHYCAHHETRWSTWVDLQLTKLEQRLVGGKSRFARVLRVLRDVPDSPNGKGTV